MVGIDTNVLIRYITQDDPAQSQIATKFIENECSAKNLGLINNIVLCEVVWVLKQAYKYDKSTIIAVLRNLLSCSEIEILDRDCAWNAFQEFIAGKADFSDYFIAQINKQHNAQYTVTFDKNTSDNSNFLILK